MHTISAFTGSDVTCKLRPIKKKRLQESWILSTCVCQALLSAVSLLRHRRLRTVDPRDPRITFHYPDTITINAASLGDLSVSIRHSGESATKLPVLLSGTSKLSMPVN